MEELQIRLGATESKEVLLFGNRWSNLMTLVHRYVEEIDCPYCIECGTSIKTNEVVFSAAVGNITRPTTCGQSYKHFMSINYDSRVVIRANF